MSEITALGAVKEARQALFAAVLDACAAERRLNGPKSVADLTKAEARADLAAEALTAALRVLAEERQALGRTA